MDMTSPMSMGIVDMAGMSVDSQGDEAALLPQPHLGAEFYHAMPGEMDAVEGSQSNLFFALDLAAGDNDSGNLACCTHGVCVQISSAISPPHPDHAPPRFLNSVSIRTMSLHAVSNRVRHRSRPPQIPLIEDLSAVLRI